MSDTAQAGKLVVVAGATGYLGRHVVRALHRQGWRVRALARDRRRLGEVEDLCHDIQVAEATSKPSLKGLFEGADAAFSSIGIRHFRRRPTFEEVDFRANLNLVEAAEARGVRRFLFVSVLDGDSLRELSPLVDARERVVDRLRQSPTMRSIILRPTGFFNDMGDVFEMARKGRVWLVGSGETRINPIHGADLADVAAEALSRAEPDAEIPAGGPEIFSQRQIAELAFRVLETPARCGRVNPEWIRLLARLARPFNGNASALALMFSALGERDAVAPRYGSHRLAEHFSNLALAASAVRAGAAQPALEDRGGTADSRMHTQGAFRAVPNTRAALHAQVGLEDLDRAVRRPEDGMRTDLQTEQAAVALRGVEGEGRHAADVAKSSSSLCPHGWSSTDDQAPEAESRSQRDPSELERQRAPHLPLDARRRGKGRRPGELHGDE
jgi:uncharacterized protein YbjT (DUF2867 family)